MQIIRIRHKAQANLTGTLMSVATLILFFFTGMLFLRLAGSLLTFPAAINAANCAGGMCSPNARGQEIVQGAFHIALSFGDTRSDLCINTDRIAGNSTTPLEFLSYIFTFRRYIPITVWVEVPRWNGIEAELCQWK